MSALEPSVIPLFPLSSGTFPDTLLRLNIFEVRYLDLIKKCEQNQTPFGVVFIQAGSETRTALDVPKLFETGTLVHLRNLDKVQPNLFQVQCLGGVRFELLSYEPGALGVVFGTVRYLASDEVVAVPASLQPVADKLGQIIAQAQQVGREGDLPFLPPYRLDECGWVANRITDMVSMPSEEKHALLRQSDPLKRLQTLAEKIRF
jgi:uncharacterized protein